MADDTLQQDQQVAAVPVVPQPALDGSAPHPAPVAPSAPAGDATGSAVDLGEIEVPPPPARSMDELVRAPFKGDRRWAATMVQTPGKIDVDHGSDAPVARPAWQDTMGAEFRQNNTIGSFVSSDFNKASSAIDPTYDPWKDIKDTPYEPYFEKFASAVNQGQADALKRDIDREAADKKTLSLSSPWVSMPFGLAAGIADPTMLVPIGGEFVIGAKGGVAMAQGVARGAAAFGGATALQEAGLQASQQTRPLSESAENIGMGAAMGGLAGTRLPLFAAGGTAALQGGSTLAQGGDWQEAGASALLGAVLGAAGAKAMQPHEWRAGVTGLENDIARGEPPTVARAAPDDGVVRLFHDSKGEEIGPSPLVSSDLDHAFGAAPENLHFADVPEDHPALAPVDHAAGFLAPSDIREMLQPFVNPETAAINSTDAARAALAGDVGAAVVAAPRLDDLTIAGAPVRAMADTKLGRLVSPLVRGLTSESAEVRDATSKLVENPVYMTMNGRGAASAQAAETLVKQYNGKLGLALQAEKGMFNDYRKNGGTALPTREAFQEEVGKAMRLGDQHPVPEVAKAAQMYRREVFDPLKEEAIKMGLLPQDVDVKTATSYFSRIWSRNKINGDIGRFKGIVGDYYAGAMKNDFVEGAQSHQARVARLDQEAADLNLGPADRAQTLQAIDVRLQALEAPGPLVDAADRLSELRRDVRDASEAGDDAKAQAARDERQRILDEGGQALADHLQETGTLRRRRSTVSMNRAGLAERSDRVLAQIGDMEDANVRSMQRLVTRGQAIQRELSGRLDPAKQAEKVSSLADGYAREAAKARRIVDRLSKVAKDEAVGPKPARPEGGFGSPQTLHQFIRAQGGIKGDGGDLQTAGLQRFGKRNGRDIDEMRRAAAEAGYLGPDTERAVEETTPADLVDAMQQHPTYSIHDQDLVDAKLHHGRAKEDRARFGDAYDRVVSSLREEHGFAPEDISHLALGDAAAQHMRGVDTLEAYERAIEARGGQVEGLPGGVADVGAQPARINKLLAQQQAKADRLDALAERLRSAEQFDRQGALDEINESLERLKAEVSGVSLKRGEERARLSERLRALDPKRVEDRLKAIDAMKKEQTRRFYDRWEIDRQGANLDPANPHLADFSEAGRDIAKHVTDTLTGVRSEGTNNDFVTVNTRGPMKDRTLNIPDALVLDFLEHNVETVARRYTRTMGADVELARKFGRPDMADQMRKINEDYERKVDASSDPRERKELAHQRDEDKKMIAHMRDMLRGTIQVPFAEKNAKKVMKMARDYAYLRAMGGVVLASLPDAARPIMVHGLGQYMTTIPRLLGNLGAVKLAGREARLAGLALDNILDHRMAVLTESLDPYAERGPIEAFTHNMMAVENTINGIRMWTDMQKSFAAIMTQSRILKNAGRGMEKINPRERAYMAYLGIDDAMARQISGQFADHGEVRGGIHVANTDAWTDEHAVRAFRGAMAKDVDSIIVQPGIGDVPFFARTPLGQMTLQFKSFTLASQQRVLYRGLQEGPARFVGGMVALTAAGMLSAYLKAIASGAFSGGQNKRLQEYTANPGKLIADGLDVGGILAGLMEIANTAEQMTGFNPIKTPIEAALPHKPDSGPGLKPDPVKLIGGPAGGLLSDAGQFASGAYDHIAHGKKMPYAAKKAGTRLIPFNNVIGIQQIMNLLAGPPPQH